MRRTETDLLNDIDDIDLKKLDKKIEQLTRIRTFRRLKQALDSVVIEDDIGSGIDGGTHKEYVKRKFNDGISEASNDNSSDEINNDNDNYEDSIKSID